MGGMIDARHAEHSTSRRLPWRLLLWAGAAALLVLPLLTMQVTPEMNWGTEDFLAAGLLVGGVGLGIELAVRLLRKPIHRMAGAGVVVLAGLLVWAELAVGILD